MDKIEIGKAQLLPEGAIKIHKRIFKMDRNKAIIQLKVNKFISKVNDMVLLDEVVLYSICCNEKTFEVLFEEGLVPDYIPNSNKYTLIMIACYSMKYRNLKLLLERGDDVNSLSIEGVSALGFTKIKIHDTKGLSISIRKLLFCYGVDLRIKSIKETNILHRISIMDGSSDFIKDVLMEASHRGKEYLEEYLEEKDSSGNTALIRATKNNLIENIREILTYGAIRNFIDSDGHNSLEYLSLENKEILEDFIDVLEIRERMYKKGIPRK